MKREKKVQINSYLAVAVSTGCIAGNAMSQTVVFYGMNSANDTNPNPSGLMGFYYTPSVTNYGTTYPAYHYVSSDSDFIIASTDFPGTFNQEVTFSCNDFSIAYAGLSGYGHGFSQYAGDGSFSNGAVAGSDNYTYVSMDGDDGIFETVAQFNFDAAGGGYLVALYSNTDGSQASIATAKAAIAAAIPEPSSLALMGLGALGVLARRNRQAVA